MSRRSAARRRLTTTAATRRSLRMAIAGLRNRAPTGRHRATIRLRGRTPRPAAAIPLLPAPIPRRAIAMAAVDPAAADTAAVAAEVAVAVAGAVAAVAEAPAEAEVPSLTAAGTKFHHWHARKPARNFRWAFLFSGAMLPVTQRWFSVSWLHTTLPVGGC